jgi:hypothetical protein
MDGPSAYSKRMVQWRDSMMTRQPKLVTFVINLMTDITNGVASRLHQIGVPAGGA